MSAVLGYDLMPPAPDLSLTVFAQPPANVAEHVRRSSRQITNHIRHGLPYSWHVLALSNYIAQFPAQMQPALFALWLRGGR